MCAEILKRLGDYGGKAFLHNLIAAISPDIYCDASVRDKVKDILKKGGDDKYVKASEVAKVIGMTPLDLRFADNNIIRNPYSGLGLQNPVEKHIFVLDAFAEALEKHYFWILTKMEDDGRKIVKLIDNFASSPGSGHFSEMGMKATKMQEEGMKLIGLANTVVKSILNLIYDLKEFKLRLELYDRLKSKKKEERNAALLSLKQVWMDTVDMKKGAGSINQLSAGNLQFVTLRDAFMAAENEKLEYMGKEMDLNERVKRLLQQRIGEFNLWLDLSEKELRKRYEIEKIYLKSQYNTVQLYARWAKPYLEAAAKLEQRAIPDASLVNAFNTTIFELVLLGSKETKLDDLVKTGNLPMIFKTKKKRKFHQVLIVEFKFRSYPERAGQGYGFKGRMEAEFTSYGLRDDELSTLKKEVEKSDFGKVLRYITDATDESLKQIKEDIDEFVYEGQAKKDQKKKEEEDINPFTALFNFLNLSDKDKKKDEEKPDDAMEKVIRNICIIGARLDCIDMYEAYMKFMGRPAFKPQEG